MCSYSITIFSHTKPADMVPMKPWWDGPTQAQCYLRCAALNRAGVMSLRLWTVPIDGFFAVTFKQNLH